MLNLLFGPLRFGEGSVKKVLHRVSGVEITLERAATLLLSRTEGATICALKA